MQWFERLCRSVGLMIHNVRHPEGRKQTVRREKQERQRGSVKLRRTTVDEVVYDRDEPPRKREDE